MDTMKRPTPAMFPSAKPIKIAPGEWECGPYTALYDEHMRAYHVYGRSSDRRVTVVRRLSDFAAYVNAQTPFGKAS